MDISGSIPSRKQQHVELVTTADVRFRSKTAGFERIDLLYDALPEIDFATISTATDVFGHACSMPFFIACMTGGYDDATNINAALADVAEELRIPIGVGSMRAALETPALAASFAVVRERAPSVPVMCNVGVVQCIRWHRAGVLADMVHRAVDMVGASIFVVHINALQEVLQPEGEPEFAGALAAIAAVVLASPIPVAVKEVGAGIGASVAARLLQAGVRAIDVAGAGGTSWAGVEILRSSEPGAHDHLWDAGIPTVACLRGVRPLVDASAGTCLWASGGITNGTEAAKAIALGAHLCSSARPVLQAQQAGGRIAVLQLLRTWELHLRQWMFLTGCSTVHQLRNAPIADLPY